MINLCKFGEVSPVGQILLWVQGNDTYLSPPETLKIRTRSEKSNQILGLSERYIHAPLEKIPRIGSRPIVGTRNVTSKIRSRSPNIISSLACLNDNFMQVW